MLIGDSHVLIGDSRFDLDTDLIMYVGVDYA